ncbi:hypothetical protein F5I97DRAFT_883824 [Phlebopus sp. FC_14]|nr:hypothetical protein F5I97DRAFT_883824 [Phlebopus sp. FC_14]
MPPKSAESLLFHKRKPIKKEPTGVPPNGFLASPRKSTTPRPQPTPPDADADDAKLPEGEYSEYKLMSSALNGWKYDVMKFDSRKLIDVSTWEEPIKLNRKDLRRQEASVSSQVPIGPMLSLDGKPVIGTDGRIVMVDAEGRPISSSNGEGSSKEKESKGKGHGNGKKKIQKKTHQVFKVPEEVRQLRREERYPWVMEDAGQAEIWIGQLEEVSKAETHALFMPAAQEVFKFVPAHRWYKFHKKPKHHVPDLEEAESLMAKIQKNKDPERWLLHRRNGQGPSAATAAMFKAEPDGHAVIGGAPLVYSAGQSRGPGGRTLRTVNRGSQGAYDEDDEGNVRPKKEDDGEGHLDEQLFEEDVADDDEHEAADIDDDEAKELEERLKREYRLANKQREGYVDESDEEGDESQLTKDGKSLKKLMRKLEKNAAYESDEESNPYASSEENEEEEEPPLVTNEPAIQQQPQQMKSRSSSQQPVQKQPRLPGPDGLGAGSRAASPTPGMGGHSVVAKRATSPKAPRPKSANVSRGSSPLSGAPGTGSRATSPAAGSRATSPVGGGNKGAGNTSPKATNKRKATDDPAPSGTAVVNGAGGAPKPKKRKPLPTGPPPDVELEERMLVEWLQNTPNATTRDCIQHFTPYLTSEAKKARFTAMVKEVAQLKGGVLILKSGNRGDSVAVSPAPVPGA